MVSQTSYIYYNKFRSRVEASSELAIARFELGSQSFQKQLHLTETQTAVEESPEQHFATEELDRAAGSINVVDLTRTYGKRTVLDGINLSISGGEMVALLGSSGAGKSTLLRQIAGLAAADTGSGHIRVSGRVVQAGGRVRKDIRDQRAGIGFIFQQFNLVDRLSLLTNVLVGHLPRVPFRRRLLRLFTHSEKLAAMEALNFVGLAGHATQRASTLSGGQQQRAAIARTMVQRARIILADEPIASLDPESARMVMDGLRRINQCDGVTVLISVHQIDHAKRSCDRIIALRSGQIYCDCRVDELNDQQLSQLYERNTL